LPQKEKREVLDGTFAGGTAKVDGFVFEVVDGSDVADGATSGAHEDGVGGGLVADKLHSWEEGALDNARGAKNGTLACDDIG
jgi:hypothetical protein